MENREEILYKHVEWIFASDKEKESFLNAMQEYSDQQNKQLLEDIEQLKSKVSNWMDKYIEVNEENKKLQSELKDCTENYNHYVDKCFKLESELKDKDSEKNIDLSVYTESFLIWLNKYFEPAYKVLPYKSKLNPNNFYSMIELEQKFNKAYNIHYKYQQPKTL